MRGSLGQGTGTPAGVRAGGVAGGTRRVSKRQENLRLQQSEESREAAQTRTTGTASPREPQQSWSHTRWSEQRQVNVNRSHVATGPV